MRKNIAKEMMNTGKEETTENLKVILETIRGSSTTENNIHII